MTLPIRIGEINSYSNKTVAGFVGPYRKGIEFGRDEINQAGGLLGRPVEIIFRDDAFDQSLAIEHANNPIIDEKVDLLLGVFNSDIALQVSEIATRHKTLFFAGEPRADALVWTKGSRYVFRLRTSQSMMSAMLIDAISQRPEKRWGMFTADHPAAKRFAEVFRAQLSVVRPNIEWIGEFCSSPYAPDPIAAVDWIEEHKPDAVFGPMLGESLVIFAREGNRRGVFKDCLIVNPLAGEPEYMAALGSDAPEGWLVLGYPGEADTRPVHREFCAAYRRYADEAPTLGALLGYTMMQVLKAAVDRAGTIETEKLVDAFEGLEIVAPFGPLRMRTDHQSTMGTWMGSLKCEDGQAAMADWKFLDGADYLPTEAEGLVRRPAAAS